jgi:hypothetical protein
MKNGPSDFLPDLNRVSRVAEVHERHQSNLEQALREAREFITFYSWVSGIKQEYLGFALEGVLFQFLFEISPARADVDKWLWVFVGDVPPAYITCEDARTPYEALDAYVGALEEWVNTAKMGQSVAHLIPVNVPATPDNAALLERRLKFIDEKILPGLK